MPIIHKVIVALSFAAFWPGSLAAMSLSEATQLAISHNPRVQAAGAERRAAGFEHQRTLGRFLPSVSLNAEFGSEKIDRPLGLSSANNNVWRNRRSVSVSVVQKLFEGGSGLNDSYRAAARIDASALRVLEESEAVALEAIEAYIDVQRHRQLVVLSSQNIERHRNVLSLARSRVNAGLAAQSEVEQVLERLAGAEAVSAEIRQANADAMAKFVNVVGSSPSHLSPVNLAPGLPSTKSAAVAVAKIEHPKIRANSADVEVAEFSYKQSASGFFPTVQLEGKYSLGADMSATPGRNEEVSAKVVLNWDLFSGGTKYNRRRELSERLAQAELLRDVAVRDITLAVERSFNAVDQGQRRVASIRKQVAANKNLVVAYRDQYRSAKRTIIELLDTEAALFSSRFQLSSARAVRVFSSYQMLATMGKLGDTLALDMPEEAIPANLSRRGNPLRHFNISIEPLRKN